MSKEFNPLQREIFPSILLRREALTGLAKEAERWFTPHPLVLVNTITLLTNGEKVDPKELSLATSITREVYNGLAQAYHNQGCPVVAVEGNRIFDLYEGTDYIPPKEPSPYGVIIHPVFLGKLPLEARGALKLLRTLPETLVSGDFQAPRIAGWRKSINRNLIPLALGDILRKELPEVPYDGKNGKYPYIVDPGIKIAEALNLTPPIHPNFINMVFIEDPNMDIVNLPHHWKQVFNWMLDGKLGAFKTLLVPYRIKKGQLDYELTLSSFEGGYVNVPSSKLAQVLMPYGSAKEVGGSEELSGVSIPLKVWQNLPEIKGLIELGHFLGERKLLAPPVKVAWFTNNPKLGKLEEKIANFTQQAEGAFMVFAPITDQGLQEQLSSLNLPWTGLPICTISGRFGAVKTDLKEDDFAAIGGFNGTKVRIVPVAGREVKGPSVEAYEFTHPLIELVLEDPEKYTIRLKKVEGGYVRDPEGDIVVPFCRGILHVHNRAEINSERVFRIDTSQFPAFSCGTDRIKEITKYILVNSHKVWSETGGKAIGAVGSLRRHGENIPLFWAENENGIIPEDPTEQFEREVRSGRLQLYPEVPMW